MIKNIEANKVGGVLARLLKNEEGNVIAILAAAVIPAIGLVGGAVDMSRIYLAQSRLQGACDAGALMGRKTMGAGTWAANSGKANAQAVRMFDINFENGAYGTTGLTKSFSESGGNVVGTASVTIPMALMQVLGQDSKTISATCQAELRIPNSDVMFVLDTTGSMGGTANGSTETKISGMRKAVKCFYEALAKQNIDDVSPADCGETVSPSATNMGSVQLRFGFVPYAVNVNVGKLLPLEYMADQWTYQSRQAETGLVPSGAPTYGTEGTKTNYNTSTNSLDPTIWEATGENIVQGSNTFDSARTTSSRECGRLSIPTRTTATIPGTTDFISQDPQNPVPGVDETVTRYYETVSVTETTEYRYNHTGDSKSGTCTLQRREINRSERTVFSRATVPVTYAMATAFTGWTYKPVTFNISGLKDPGNNIWRSSFAMPLGTEGANINIGWRGCVEERQTYRATDTDPSNDWDPIPSAALDMNIDMAPTAGNITTLWGPLLPSAIWERYTLNSDKTRSSTRTRGDVFVGRNDDATMPTPANNCPTESKKFQTWSPTAFKNYVNDMTIGGNTYHDIGLLWGGRIMSPTGIFASLNAPANLTIERHMVFMTDGGTNVINDDYSAYGIHWYDRRQTQDGSAPSNTTLNSTVDARTAALCKAIKNKNITLWVVSYGESIDTATNARLSACATPGKFIEATSVTALVSEFKAIAAEISALRLTQ